MNTLNNANKGIRLIKIYEMLNRGEYVSKKYLIDMFNVTAKSIQRDINDLRIYLNEEYNDDYDETIKYSKNKDGYYLVKNKRRWMTESEVLSICKIILESRAFCKDELDLLLDKILLQVDPTQSIKVKDMINNEKFYYVPPRHNKELIHKIWDLSANILESSILEIDYQRQDHKVTHRKIKPVSIMFSDYYFYLIAFMADSSKDLPAVFRIDRIMHYKDTSQKFDIPYKDRFNEGEFRKRVAFMYSGELKTVKFKFSGTSLEAILDRLPTAQVLEDLGNGVYIISAETYGDGINMWLKSQGDWVEIIN